MAKAFIRHIEEFRMYQALPLGANPATNKLAPGFVELRAGEEYMNMRAITIMFLCSQIGDVNKFKLFTRVNGVQVDITSFFTKTVNGKLVQYKLTDNNYPVIIIGVDPITTGATVDVAFLGSNS